MNRIALAFMIAMLYTFALEIPHQVLLDPGYMYELKVVVLFLLTWMSVGVLIHADHIVHRLKKRQQAHSLRDL